MKDSKIMTLYFFAGYAFLMISLIYFALNVDLKKVEQANDHKISETFSKEIHKAAEKSAQRAAKNEGKWQPSNQFIMTAMIVASILDIIIILLWARYENKKREGGVVNPRRITNQKWFWNLIALGIVQPRDGRIVLNWKNLIGVILFMIIIKFWISDRLQEL
jgi:hypothetical protein